MNRPRHLRMAGAIRRSRLVGVDESMESMRREMALREALARATGGKAQLLDPRPLVRVRVTWGRAVAVTDTHVLHEWVRFGEYHCRWDEKWQVQRVDANEWQGEEF